jgi:hypothetical protein
MAWLSDAYKKQQIDGGGTSWLSKKFIQQAKQTGEKFRQQTVAANQAQRWATGNTQVTPMSYKWQQPNQGAYMRAMGAFVRTMTAGRSQNNQGSIMRGIGNGVYNLTNAFSSPSGVVNSGSNGGGYNNGGGNYNNGGGYTTSNYLDPFYTDMMKWII